MKTTIFILTIILFILALITMLYNLISTIITDRAFREEVKKMNEHLDLEIEKAKKELK